MRPPLINVVVMTKSWVLQSHHLGVERDETKATSIALTAGLLYLHSSHHITLLPSLCLQTAYSIPRLINPQLYTIHSTHIHIQPTIHGVNLSSCCLDFASGIHCEVSWGIEVTFYHLYIGDHCPQTLAEDISTGTCRGGEDLSQQLCVHVNWWWNSLRHLYIFSCLSCLGLLPPVQLIFYFLPVFHPSSVLSLQYSVPDRRV